MYSDQWTVPGTSEERRVLKNRIRQLDVREADLYRGQLIGGKEVTASRCTRAGCGLGPWIFRSTVMRIGKG